MLPSNLAILGYEVLCKKKTGSQSEVRVFDALDRMLAVE
jgi:hypothetical protein